MSDDPGFKVIAAASIILSLVSNICCKLEAIKSRFAASEIGSVSKCPLFWAVVIHKSIHP